MRLFASILGALALRSSGWHLLKHYMAIYTRLAARSDSARFQRVKRRMVVLVVVGDGR